MEEYDNQFKISCQSYNIFVACRGRSGEMLYIIFLHDGFFTLVLYPEVLYS